MRNLRVQWKDVLEKRISHIHGGDKIRLERQNRKYFNLKTKFTKLKEDHKSLLGECTVKAEIFISSCMFSLCTFVQVISNESKFSVNFCNSRSGNSFSSSS